MKRSKPISVKVSKDSMKNAENLNVFLVDEAGELKETVAIKNGEAKLKSLASDVHGKSKIFIAGEIPKEFASLKIDEKLLTKINAFQPNVEISSKNIIDIPFIPEITKIFPFTWCNITGSVSKFFTIDGMSKKLPICNARIHICEVDHVSIFQPVIPDDIFIDLRERLKDFIRIPKPNPIPDPGPVFRNRIVSKGFIPEINPEFSSLAINLKLDLPTEIHSALFSTDLRVAKRSIINNFKLFHPWICLWPIYWPYFYKCDELKVVKPDCNGRFNTHIIYSLLADKPDIYIWVEVFDGTNWITVYKPPIACNTWWNYTCGTDIKITVTDTRVKPCVCAPIEGAVVWMKRIGSAVSMRNIQQSAAPSGHLADAQGLTKFSNGLYLRPFARSFPFVVQFGSGFPNTSVTHYRWSYQRIKDAKLNPVSETLKSLEGNVAKAYTFEFSTPSGTQFGTGSVPLGPTYNAAGDPQYKIPKVEASDEVAEPTAEWNQDTISTRVLSNNLENGLFEFTFELLDGSGNVVPVPVNTFLIDDIPNTDPLAATVFANTVNSNYVTKNSSGQAIAFKFKMRIDNDPCYADIKDALVDGAFTDPDCGLGFYSNKANPVNLIYQAGHPQDFATYSFRVTRGNSNLVVVENTLKQNIVPGSDLSVVPVLVNGDLQDEFTKEVTVQSILGPCDDAAFAETLHVVATHTDGGADFTEYNRSDTAAISVSQT